MKLSFVIPCYGSENTIAKVIEEIEQTMGQRPEYQYEIITINDCSPDNVFNILKMLAYKKPSLKVIDLAQNMGKHSAIMAGYSVVTGDLIVNIDDDGQCPVDKLWNLVDVIDEGYDVAIAKYPIKKQSAFKNFGSHVNSMMSKLLIGKPKNIQISNFSILKRYVVDEIKKYEHAFPYLEGLILRTTKSIKNVEMEDRNRFAGNGNFNFIKSFSLWLNGFTAFSVKPLRISTYLGFLVACIGFVFGIIVIIRKIITPSIMMGYSSLMAVVLFIGGIIMLMLGLIGEYIGRIYICINNSPQYVIKEKINIGNLEESSKI